MVTRIITAVVLIAVFLPLFIIGGPLTYLMVGIVGIMCMYELTSLRHENIPKWMRYLIIIMGTSLCFSSFDFFAWGLLTLMVVMFIIAIITPEFKLEDVTLFTTLSLFIGLTGHSVLMLGTMDGMYLIYICSITYGVDTGAYFIGKFFGKHKLNERISPKKTIEGTVAGFISGIIISVIFAIFVPEITYGLLGGIVYGIGLSICGQIGDLIFSLIKRNYSIKDYGSFLPGHGGMLDRIDSLLLNCCTFMVLTYLINLII